MLLTTYIKKNKNKNKKQAFCLRVWEGEREKRKCDRHVFFCFLLFFFLAAESALPSAWGALVPVVAGLLY